MRRNRVVWATVAIWLAGAATGFFWSACLNEFSWHTLAGALLSTIALFIAVRTRLKEIRRSEEEEGD